MRLFRIAFFLLLSAASLPARSPAQDSLFTPQHVAKLRIVTAAVISPDGSQVAYLLSVPRNIPKEKDGPSWSELHVVNSNFSTKAVSTPFITGAVNIGDISWTPDGKDIAFLAKRDKDETKSLYVIGAHGGESRKILSHATDLRGYSFSGDGKQVAFLATEPIAKKTKTRQDQGFTQQIYDEQEPFVRVWVAPLAVAHSDSAAENPKATMLKLEGSASELHWNPKEDKLAVALAKTPLIDDHLMFRKVHLVELTSRDREGAVVKKATNLDNPGKLGQVAWSLDGKKLAIISGADKYDPMQGRLWILDEGKKDWYKVADPYKGHAESIAWFRKFKEAGVEHSPAVIASKGVSSSTLFGGDTPEVIIASISATNDIGERFAVIAQCWDIPPEVGIMDRSQLQVHRLTNSNPWLKEMKFAKQEVIRYKARDGLELEGILIHPLDEKKGEKYPLILNVHGGPESHYANGWLTNYNMLGQVAAAKGMAVFYPNYRGSTGYGVEFSMKGQKDAAGKEFDDLIDAVDHLVKVGLVDEKKVGITGGSYGGYATAWCCTKYSDRFAAGVMFVGLSDLVSCAGTTDIPYEMDLVHHRQWLWDDWDYFLKRSPIFYVEKAKTPLLIACGKNDPRVHPSQSLELYRHLKVLGKAPVRLVQYPGEGHGNARAASRLDYNVRLLQWMEHYLKGHEGAMPPMDLDYGLETPAPAKTAPAGDMSWDNREPAVPAMTGRCPCCIGW